MGGTDLRDRLEPTLRRALLAGADGVGRISSGARVLPGLLICGGQRCGTTSMYKALVQQPTIFRPTWRKGVHFFDTSPDRSLEWYRAHFPLRAQLERAERRHGTRALAFESSPYYLFHPRAAERIAAALPDVKVLTLVRDPVERAYSAHAHELARGYEDLDFAAALRAEPERLAGEQERMAEDPGYESHVHRHQAYRSRGEYAAQLDRFAQLLGPDRVMAVDSHRFFSDPEPVYARVLEWLGVESRVDPHFDRHNARPRTDMDPTIRQELRDYFEPHDRELTRWLGRAPSWREEPGAHVQ